jgi:hypothetical protein
MKAKLTHDGFTLLDHSYLRKASLHMSYRAFEKLAIELGIELDGETVSFMRQAFMQVATELREQEVRERNERLRLQAEMR